MKSSLPVRTMVERLGKYEIIRTLGRGAMGEVYLAHHPVIGREVAIKTILPGSARGEDAEGRFRREATAAGKLNHPNLVTIYDFDKDGDILYLVMEYVKGEDLEELIREKDLTQAQFLEVLAQVCDGLAFAHKAGIIHRDIKPANVRVTRDGKRLLAKVMDFGIARTEDSGMTATGMVMGTVSYMAPEYIQTGKATLQADLWAVGVMLYECLSGRRPFAAETTTTILFKIVSENPVPIEREEIHGISPLVRSVLERALDKDPAKRFLSAEELAKALRACKDPTWGVVATSSATVTIERQEAAQAALEAAPYASGGVPSPAASAVTPTVAVPASSAYVQPTVAMPASTAPVPMQATTAVPAPVPSTVAMPTSTAPVPMQATQAVPAVSAPPTAALGVPAPYLPAKPRRTGLYLAAGAAAVAVLGVGGWLALGRKPATPAQAEGLPAAAASTVVLPSAPGGLNPMPAAAPGAQPAAKAEPARQEASATVPTQPVSQAPLPKVETPAAEAPRIRATPPAEAEAPESPVLRPPTSHDSKAHGAYLAALYNAKRYAEFERAYESARSAGFGPLQLFDDPGFRSVFRAEMAALNNRKEPLLGKTLAMKMRDDFRK